jgi:hypothetical protein
MDFLTTNSLQTYFNNFDFSTTSCPSIDLPESAIDHFNVRDSDEDVIMIHHEAHVFLYARGIIQVKSTRALNKNYYR